MSTRIRIGTSLAIAIVGLLAPACGDSSRADAVSAHFQSSEWDYYASFFASATGEAFGGQEVPHEERRATEALIRDRSRVWAMAMREDLELYASGRFSFRYAVVADIPKGESRLTAEVKTTKMSERRGTWLRAGEQLVLRVQEQDGKPVASQEDWALTWRGDEVVMPGWRETGPFAGSILRRAGGGGALR